MNHNRARLNAKEISTIAIFTAVTAVLAQISIPLPFTPMPISFGLVAVYITGIMLKPSHAVYAQICYLALGAIGIPVFANFRGGIAALLGPTGGYLMAYPLMVWIVATVLNGAGAPEVGRGRLLVRAGIAMLIAHLVLYLGGTAWFTLTTGNSFQASLALAVYPFIPLDIIKILFCVFVVVPFRARLRSMNLLLV